MNIELNVNIYNNDNNIPVNDGKNKIQSYITAGKDLSENSGIRCTENTRTTKQYKKYNEKHKFKGDIGNKDSYIYDMKKEGENSRTNQHIRFDELYEKNLDISNCMVKPNKLDRKKNNSFPFVDICDSECEMTYSEKKNKYKKSKYKSSDCNTYKDLDKVLLNMSSKLSSTKEIKQKYLEDFSELKLNSKFANLSGCTGEKTNKSVLINKSSTDYSRSKKSQKKSKITLNMGHSFESHFIDSTPPRKDEIKIHEGLSVSVPNQHIRFDDSNGSPQSKRIKLEEPLKDDEIFYFDVSGDNKNSTLKPVDNRGCSKSGHKKKPKDKIQTKISAFVDICNSDCEMTYGGNKKTKHKRHKKKLNFEGKEDNIHINNDINISDIVDLIHKDMNTSGKLQKPLEPSENCELTSENKANNKRDDTEIKIANGMCGEELEIGNDKTLVDLNKKSKYKEIKKQKSPIKSQHFQASDMWQNTNIEYEISSPKNKKDLVRNESNKIEIKKKKKQNDEQYLKNETVECTQNVLSNVIFKQNIDSSEVENFASFNTADMNEENILTDPKSELNYYFESSADVKKIFSDLNEILENYKDCGAIKPSSSDVRNGIERNSKSSKKLHSRSGKKRDGNFVLENYEEGPKCDNSLKMEVEDHSITEGSMDIGDLKETEIFDDSTSINSEEMKSEDNNKQSKCSENYKDCGAIKPSPSDVRNGIERKSKSSKKLHSRSGKRRDGNFVLENYEEGPKCENSLKMEIEDHSIIERSMDVGDIKETEIFDGSTSINSEEMKSEDNHKQSKCSENYKDCGAIKPSSSDVRNGIERKSKSSKKLHSRSGKKRDGNFVLENYEEGPKCDNSLKMEIEDHSIIESSMDVDDIKEAEIDDKLDLAEKNADVINCEEEFDITSLRISLPFPIHPLHTYFSRPSKPRKEELEAVKAAKIKIKTGMFSAAEDQMIRDNWERFCEEHNIIMDPFYFFKFPKGMNSKERLKFLQYMAHGLENRLLHLVHKRMRYVYKNPWETTGRFTTEEDRKIIKYFDPDQPVTSSRRLSKLLNRSNHSVKRRYDYLTQFSTDIIKWDIKLVDKFVNYMLQICELDNVEDMRNITFSASQLNKLSEKMKIPKEKLRRAWKITIHPRLFTDNSTDLVKIKTSIINTLHKNNESDWRALNWQKIARKYETLTPQRIYMLFRQTVQCHVPKKLRKNLKECLRFLKNKLDSGDGLYAHKLHRFEYVDGHVRYADQDEV